MKVRHIYAILFLIGALALAGCAPKMVCSSPNVMVGDTCCLDADDNGICDTWEDDEEPEIVRTEPEPEPAPQVDTRYEDFAESFASTWDRKSYTAMHNLFVRDTSRKFSAKEFNFLARKMDALEGISGVQLREIDEDTATYTVFLGGKTVTLSADIDEEDGDLKHEAFYFFDDLNVDTACDDEDCYFDFAVISGDMNLCSDAGERKLECKERFGISSDMSSQMDECLEIMEYYGRVECLTSLAVNENTVEPCWQATHDKQIFECMGEVAAAREDSDECEEMISSHGFPGTRLQMAYCLLGYVKTTTDTDACADIDRRSDVVLGALQEGCYNLNFP